MSQHGAILSWQKIHVVCTAVPISITLAQANLLVGCFVGRIRLQHDHGPWGSDAWWCLQREGLQEILGLEKVANPLWQTLFTLISAMTRMSRSPGH